MGGISLICVDNSRYALPDDVWEKGDRLVWCQNKMRSDKHITMNKAATK